MSLRWKVILLLCGVFVVLMGMIRLIDDAIVVPSFVRLERDEAATDLSRCVRAIESEIESVDKLCREWAAASPLAADEPNQCLDQPFSPEVLRNEDLGIVMVIDAGGAEAWVQARPPDTDGEPNAEKDFDPGLSPGHVLRAPAEPERAIKGLAAVGSRVLIASSHPILRGPAHQDRDSAPAGRVIVGRWLDGRCRDRIVERTCVALDVWPLIGTTTLGPADSATAAAAQRASAALGREGDLYVDDRDPAMLQVFCKQQDIDGKPIVLLRAHVARHITAVGQAARDFLLSALVSLLVIILVLVWMQLEIMVVKPVQQLRDHVTRVGQDGDLELRLDAPRQDELGDLCRAFNEMTGSLAAYRRRLVDAAHRSGMSDTAANILHNVGNVLNSVFVSTDVLSAAAAQSRVARLTRAAELLQAHRANLGEFLTRDDRGRKLPDYLWRLAELLNDEQKNFAAEVRLLQDKVQHIRDVIATQQALASGPRLATHERLDIIVREALAVQESVLRRAGVSVKLELAETPPVLVSRPKLLQVLDNLIKNAAEAITERDAAFPNSAAERRITFRSASTDAGVELQVTDTGIGFDPAHRDQIFRFGFTTKPDGHGLGLHYCANALTEMGGTIRADSSGRGTGATFTITLAGGDAGPDNSARPAAKRVTREAP